MLKPTLTTNGVVYQMSKPTLTINGLKFTKYQKQQLLLINNQWCIVYQMSKPTVAI